MGGVAAISTVLPTMLTRRTGALLACSGAGSGPLVMPQIADAAIAAAGLRNWMMSLNDSLQDSDVYAAHVALAVQIARGSEPAVIADAMLEPGVALPTRTVLAWAELAGQSPGRLRPCVNSKCRLFSVDRSKTQNGRWFSMAVCGNRIKARWRHARTREQFA